MISALGLTHLITEHRHTQSSPHQEPMSLSRSCLSLSAHIPICKTVLPFDLKVTHLKFALSSFLSSLPECSLNSHLHSYYGASYCDLSSFRGETLIILHHHYLHKAHVQYIFIHIYFLFKKYFIDCTGS